MQAHTLFADETSPSQRSDFQDGDAKCKIFTCCGEVNKLPSLACWDQSKVWFKDLKARDGMWQGRAGGRDACLCFPLHVRSRLCSLSDCAQIHHSCVRYACVMNLWRARPEQESHKPRGGRLCGVEENMAASNRIVTLESKARTCAACLIANLGSPKVPAG